MNHPFDYWAEVTAEGPVYGSHDTARVVLAEYQSPFIRAAVRWLATQALRIADGLDPHPRMRWFPTGALRIIPDHIGDQLDDVPAQLRAWAGSADERRATYQRLRNGDPFALIVSDHSGVYVLALWPVAMAATPTTPHADRARHRKRRQGIPLLKTFLKRLLRRSLKGVRRGRTHRSALVPSLV
ncbi:hypothetical protein [Streptomyces albipurpureus]|uniref:Uncharacterized protein n=1 Tax=Streptomyces albipurpureus TaxID=2897419 RepID=A0ABT0ULQ5_9ACTN|nr:hypothetical protein [Streptomyces sp. CWNU-1]MCM2389354.1 hypothetical protein [Streptomyces sp. CWNU-1]